MFVPCSIRKACFSQNSGWEKSSGLLIHNCQALCSSWLFLKNLKTVTKLLHEKVEPFTANVLPLKMSLFLQILCFISLRRWCEGWLEGSGQTLHLGMSNYSVLVCSASRSEGGCLHSSYAVNDSRTQDSLDVAVVVSRTHSTGISVCEWKSSKGLISFFIKCLALFKKQKHCWGCGNTTYDSIERVQKESDCRMCFGADKGVGTGLKTSYSETMK